MRGLDWTDDAEQKPQSGEHKSLMLICTYFRYLYAAVCLFDSSDFAFVAAQAILSQIRLTECC